MRLLKIHFNLFNSKSNLISILVLLVSYMYLKKLVLFKLDALYCLLFAKSFLAIIIFQSELLQSDLLQLGEVRVVTIEKKSGEEKQSPLNSA